MIQKYFEEELLYLYESGKEFARIHPETARFLDIDAVGDRDPYVERLFEGFAFLSGRIRERLDDSFPELTEGLVNMLWPQFLHEIPSLSIVQFKPRKGHLQGTRLLPRGSELLSVPVGPDYVPCRFTTTQEIALNPLSLDFIKKSCDSNGRTELTLYFKVDRGVQWKKMQLDPLRIFIHAEHSTAVSLHEFICRHVREAFLVIDENSHAIAQPQITGFSPLQSIVPDDPSEFRSKRLLLEYFVFPEKFLFFDITGINFSELPESAGCTFSVRLNFDCEIPQSKVIETGTFRLFCSPAVNLYVHDTEPVYNTGKKTEYAVKADIRHRFSTVHSILNIDAFDRRTGKKITYSPGPVQLSDAPSFCTAYRKNFSGQRELYIRLSGNRAPDELPDETLSIRAFCTEGLLPREELREGSINTPGRDFPDFATFANITRPTLPFLPPEDKDLLWVFLSQLSAVWSSFSSAESLRNQLSVYEWSGSRSMQRKIDSICEVNVKPAQSLFRGGLVRGVEFLISVQETGFPDPQELFLFGEVLREFLSRHITINSFLLLSIKLTPSEMKFSWNSLDGKKWPI